MDRHLVAGLLLIAMFIIVFAIAIATRGAA